MIGRPDPVFGEKTVAYVAKKDTEMSAERLHAYCAEHLSEYKVPDHIIFIEQIPKSGTGKMLKTALKEYDKKQVTS